MDTLNFCVFTNGTCVDPLNSNANSSVSSNSTGVEIPETCLSKFSNECYG